MEARPENRGVCHTQRSGGRVPVRPRRRDDTAARPHPRDPPDRSRPAAHQGPAPRDGVRRALPGAAQGTRSRQQLSLTAAPQGTINVSAANRRSQGMQAALYAAPPVLSLIGFIVLWQLYVWDFSVSNFILPSPMRIGQASLTIGFGLLPPV